MTNSDSFEPPDSSTTIELVGQTEVTVGRSRSCNVMLHHASIGRRHARFLCHNNTVEIEDLNSRFGTSVNGNRVGKVRLKEGDLVRFGSSEPYRFMGHCLKLERDASGIRLDLANVTVIGKNKNNEPVTLLDKVNLHIESGEFVGLLGPSGGGKSVLLGCLASTREAQGSITFDGGRTLEGADLEYYRSKLGIVSQEELTYGSLTVEENIRFAGLLRISEDEKNDLQERIDTVLRAVNLTEHRDKTVYPTLSGGQKRRLSVGLELLTRPRLLLLDEPTSGLDPGMHARVMDTMRRLSLQGITVVMSTHTMDALNYFDSVVVLAPTERGTGVAFHGTPSELLPAFKVQNTADLFDILSGGKQPPNAGDATSNSIASIDDEGMATEPKTGETGNTVELMRDMRSPFSRDQIGSQAKVVFQRSLLAFQRDTNSLRLAIAQPFVLALLICFSQMTKDKSTYIHFFLVVAAIWMGMTLTVRELVRERALYLRDRLAGLLPESYLLGKAAFGVTLAAIQGTILYVFARGLCLFLVSETSVLGHLNGVSPFFKGSPFLANISCSCLGLVVILIVAGGGAVIGLTISSWAKSEQFAVLLLPLVILPQMLLSRVANGGSESWATTSSPYAAIIDTKAFMQGVGVQKDTLTHGVRERETALFASSFLLLSRPATAAIDMLSQDPNYEGGGIAKVLVEWVYLMLVITLHVALLYQVFMQMDRTWKSAR